ncbi:hypothetical protein ACFWIA_34910 [Streptomyces sp. NPDC127068]
MTPRRSAPSRDLDALVLKERVDTKNGRSGAAPRSPSAWPVL